MEYHFFPHFYFKKKMPTHASEFCPSLFRPTSSNQVKFNCYIFRVLIFYHLSQLQLCIHLLNYLILVFPIGM